MHQQADIWTDRQTSQTLHIIMWDSLRLALIILLLIKILEGVHTHTHTHTHQLLTDQFKTPGMPFKE